MAYKVYKRCFQVFGLPTHIRSNGASNLAKAIWPPLMKLLGIEQLVGTAMSSDSNDIAENKNSHYEANLCTDFGKAHSSTLEIRHSDRLDNHQHDTERT